MHMNHQKMHMNQLVSNLHACRTINLGNTWCIYIMPFYFTTCSCFILTKISMNYIRSIYAEETEMRT